MSDDRDASVAFTQDPLWRAGSWLAGETFETISELNEECLELIAQQAAAARAPSVPMLTGEMRTLWCALDSGSRHRAAQCPCLLVDAGFLDAGRWAAALGRRIQDGGRTSVPAAFFTVPRTIPVMRLLLASVWHLVRSNASAARLLMGIVSPCAELIATSSLSAMLQIAEEHTHLLQPRWKERTDVWRDLLIAAQRGEPAALEAIRLRGVALLAGEVWASQGNA